LHSADDLESAQKRLAGVALALAVMNAFCRVPDLAATEELYDCLPLLFKVRLDLYPWECSHSGSQSFELSSQVIKARGLTEAMYAERPADAGEVRPCAFAFADYGDVWQVPVPQETAQPPRRFSC
jgi:hypothetical protein